MGHLRGIQGSRVWQGPTKKLTDAVAALFRTGGKQELEQDFAQFGGPPPGLTDAIEHADTIELWPENVEPISVFMRLQSQWRVGPAGPLGLEYSCVESFLRLARVKRTPELFADIQAMETAALRAMRGE